jgi:hypothetical protein
MRKGTRAVVNFIVAEFDKILSRVIKFGLRLEDLECVESLVDDISFHLGTCLSFYNNPPYLTV